MSGSTPTAEPDGLRVTLAYHPTQQRVVAEVSGALSLWEPRHLQLGVQVARGDEVPRRYSGPPPTLVALMRLCRPHLGSDLEVRGIAEESPGVRLNEITPAKAVGALGVCLVTVLWITRGGTRPIEVVWPAQRYSEADRQLVQRIYNATRLRTDRLSQPLPPLARRTSPPPVRRRARGWGETGEGSGGVGGSHGWGSGR